MYDETITLFNRYEDQTGNVYYYPTVLQHVDLITDKVANIVRTGIDSADTASLHVAYTPDNGTIMVQGKKWLSPKAWKAQTNEELPGTITFANEDFFVLGDYCVKKEQAYLIDNNGAYVQDHEKMPISTIVERQMYGVVKDAEYTSRVDRGFYDYMNKKYDNVLSISNVGGPYRLIPHFEIGGK